MQKPSHKLSGFGRVVTGSVLDCNKDALERSLKFYDRYLYIKWNTDKLDGRGCWEIRRAPEYPTMVCHGTLDDGSKLYTYERKEVDFIHHVLDCPVLHYGLLGKIKSMDAWKYKDFDAHLENVAVEHEQKVRKNANEEMRYDLKQHKQEWKKFASLVSEGADLGAFLKGIKG